MATYECRFPGWIITILVAFVAACFTSAFWAATLEDQQQRNQSEAIKANVAEWVSDENGKPVFRWKECAKP